MHSTYALYNIVPTAFLILLIAIFIDFFIDKYRVVEKFNKNRVILYSFIFFCICLIQIKIGGITLAQNPADESRSYISTNDWLGIFDTLNLNISVWNYSAIIYNVILFVPLGIFLILLFNVKKYNLVISIVVLSCFVIDGVRLILGLNGFLTRINSNLSLIYLMFNILGGVLGVYIIKFINTYKLNVQITSSNNQ